MKMYLPPTGRGTSRRVVLRRGLVGGLLLATGGGGYLWARKSADVRVPAGLKVLSAQEYAVVAALALCFIPRRERFPRPEELGTAATVDAILALTDATTQVEVRQLLMLFENALPNFLFGGRVRPFTRLSEEEQSEVLDEWRGSRLAIRRTGYLALRTLVHAAYFGDARVWPAFHYPGPPAGYHDASAPVWKGASAP